MSGFFVRSVSMPPDLPPLESGLYGPAAGDPPVAEADIHWTARPGRQWASRMVDKPPRPTNILTVIAGPSAPGKDDCILYTVYGGPLAPRELNDPDLRPEDRAEAEAFWAIHALAMPASLWDKK